MRNSILSRRRSEIVQRLHESVHSTVHVWYQPRCAFLIWSGMSELSPRLEREVEATLTWGFAWRKSRLAARKVRAHSWTHRITDSEKRGDFECIFHPRVPKQHGNRRAQSQDTAWTKHDGEELCFMTARPFMIHTGHRGAYWLIRRWAGLTGGVRFWRIQRQKSKLVIQNHSEIRPRHLKSRDWTRHTHAAEQWNIILSVFITRTSKLGLFILWIWRELAKDRNTSLIHFDLIKALSLLKKLESLSESFVFWRNIERYI